MRDDDNDESAFPTNESNYVMKWSSPGMTLRDYFAAKAMQALITAMPHMPNIQNRAGGKVSENDIAEQSFIFSDAMLEARKK